MNAKVVRMVLVGVCCLVASGCVRSATLPPAAKTGVLDTSLASTGGFPSPFRFDVVDELNDGERLHLLATVRSLAEWNPDSVVVRLTGFKNGEAAGTTDYGLRQLVGNGPIEKNTPLTVSLSIPAAGITDYEVQLLWGEEAQSGAPDKAMSKIVLVSKTVEQETVPCENRPCPIQFAVSAELQNGGAIAVDAVRLAVGFLVNSGSLPAGRYGGVPPNEEVIELSNLHLAPGETRSVRIVIDQPVPAARAEQVLPAVRVVG